MKKRSTKEVFLFLLIAGLGVVLYVQYQKWSAASRNPTEIAIAAVKRVNAQDMPPLIDVLSARGPLVKIRPHSRNLFNYSKSPDEVADEIRQQREMERLAKEAAERRRLQQEAEAKARAEHQQEVALHPPKPEPPPITFRFIGKMGQSGAEIAILADANSGDIYTVREGELLGAQFKVRKIEFDAVTIGYQNPEWADQSKVIKMGS